MSDRALALANFRRFARFFTTLSVALTVAGIYAATKGEWLGAALGVGAGIAALFIVQRVQIRTVAGSEHILVVVTGRDCSLCDEAKARLAPMLEGTPFQIEEVDVRRHRFLRRFRHEIPVLLWQGEVLAQLGWDYGAIKARLEGILAQHPAPASKTPKPAA